jgi:prepilin-type N-terminal cleavage/methylation domain-containing protein
MLVMNNPRNHIPSGRYNRGFTLIELLTVIAIMSLITLALLAEQGKFDSSTVLRSLAYSVALSARQAQVYGVSVVGVSSSGSVNYVPAYGLYFASTLPQSYILFADANGNGQYDTGEIVKTFTLNNGYTIANVCAKYGASQWRCFNPSQISYFEILFKRPNPDAQFLALNSSQSPVAGPYSEAYITVSGPNGDTRAVSVSTTGEIAVWAPNTTPL